MDKKELHLLDFPNEILYLILKKLDNVDVLYSLFDINNHRLGMIVQSSMFTSTFDFVSTSPSTHQTSPISHAMLDRFCSVILPKIHVNIKSLTLEPASLERILFVGEYPNLTKLRVYNFHKSMISPNLPDKCLFRYLRLKQITDLTLIADENIVPKTYGNCLVPEYAVLLTLFGSLERLTIVPALINYDSSFRSPPSLRTSFSSSILTHLSVHVIAFDECLILLDGRLKHLTSFTVQIHQIDQKMFSASTNTDDLSHLRCFSLTSYNRTEGYTSRILPLLRRMSHLLELTLYLHTIRQSTTVIDGTHLDSVILNHMPRLRTFTFYMATKYASRDPMVHLSHEDIQQTFINPAYQEVASMIDYFLGTKVIHRVFSLPFQFARLQDITNHFPDMIFDTVIYLTVKDKVGFKDEFFVRLACCFPFLKHLRICNILPPPLNAYEGHLLDGGWSSLLRYPYLLSLELEQCNEHYTEHFLNNARTYLPGLIQLRIPYFVLKFVTENFTREATRGNCANVKRLFVKGLPVYSQDVHDYFPSLAM